MDWNSTAAFDVSAAATAVADAITRGEVELPIYDLSADQVVGEQRWLLNEGEVFIAEGVFARPVYEALPGGLLSAVTPVYLDHGRIRSALARLRGDREEGRLPVLRSVAVTIRLGIKEPPEFGPIEGARRVRRADMPDVLLAICRGSKS